MGRLAWVKDVRVPQASSDYRLVYWPGLTAGPLFTFTETEARLIRELWEARFDGDEPEVPHAILIQAGKGNATRVADVFRRNPAWNTLVIRGSVPGKYKLPEPSVTG